jgi:hypothetical protein
VADQNFLAKKTKRKKTGPGKLFTPKTNHLPDPIQPYIRYKVLVSRATIDNLKHKPWITLAGRPHRSFINY